MTKSVPMIRAAILLGAVAASPAFGQAAGNPTSGTGGAREQMLPSTVGAAPGPYRGVRSSEPIMRAIQPHRHWRHRRRYDGY